MLISCSSSAADRAAAYQSFIDFIIRLYQGKRNR